jgi:hypothetical protein
MALMVPAETTKAGAPSGGVPAFRSGGSDLCESPHEVGVGFENAFDARGYFSASGLAADEEFGRLKQNSVLRNVPILREMRELSVEVFGQPQCHSHVATVTRHAEAAPIARIFSA